MREQEEPTISPSVTSIAKSGAVVVLGLRQDADTDAIFDIFDDVVERGDGYPNVAPLTKDVFDAIWVHSSATVVARVNGVVMGAYYLKPNFPGRAAHIANAGYVVARSARGMGIGELLVEDSIRRAPEVGFDAIQFNLVFASNPARALYERQGWKVIGRVPDAVDDEEALIYWRRV